MRNPLTLEFEGYIGVIFLGAVVALFVGLFFSIFRNYYSDVEILNSTQAQVKSVSPTQRELIDDWIREDNIELPEGMNYRQIIHAYPDHPWMRRDVAPQENANEI